MERFRRKTTEGRSGVVQCGPEGCELKSESIGVCAIADGEAPPADCLLQLRLRAGDVEKPCRGTNSNVCVGEGCFGESCVDHILNDEPVGDVAWERDHQYDGIVQRVQHNIFDWVDEHPADLGEEIYKNFRSGYLLQERYVTEFLAERGSSRIGRIHIRDGEDD